MPPPMTNTLSVGLGLVAKCCMHRYGGRVEHSAACSSERLSGTRKSCCSWRIISSLQPPPTAAGSGEIPILTERIASDRALPTERLDISSGAALIELIRNSISYSQEFYIRSDLAAPHPLPHGPDTAASDVGARPARHGNPDADERGRCRRRRCPPGCCEPVPSAAPGERPYRSGVSGVAPAAHNRHAARRGLSPRVLTVRMRLESRYTLHIPCTSVSWTTAS